ncbi:MAG: hypothetical protein Q4E57_07490 [Eubacteriales bacterium]|nr:hypothetical protein [Eubacteriales bacterium]
MNIKITGRLVRNVLIVVLILGVIAMLFGFGKRKYTVHLDGGFKSSSIRTRYAAGEEVTVYYDVIATDTDYYFSSDQVELKQSYDDEHGYVFTFIMPAQDVTFNVETRNSMMYSELFTVNFVNNAEKTALWIIPDTEDNRKTTLWGEAVLGDVEKGSSHEITLETYIYGTAWLLRMIDKDQMYYEVNGVELRDGCTISIRKSDLSNPREGSDQCYLEVDFNNGEDPVVYVGFFAAIR